MKLLTELLENTVKLVEETLGEGYIKKHFLSGTFMQADVVNRNKRIYPLAVLENEVNRYIKDKVETNRAYGELNHPQGPTINGDRICMHVREIVKEGSNFVGKALIATTPMGNIVKGLLSDGASLGVSSRALGSLKPVNDGVNEVGSDLRLCAIDCVTDPSGPQCYVEGILEGKEWVYDPISGNYVEQSEIVQKVVEQTVEKHKEELELKPARVFDEAKQIEMFEQYLKALVYKVPLLQEEAPRGPTVEDCIKKFLGENAPWDERMHGFLTSRGFTHSTGKSNNPDYHTYHKDNHAVAVGRNAIKPNNTDEWRYEHFHKGNNIFNSRSNDSMMQHLSWALKHHHPEAVK